MAIFIKDTPTGVSMKCVVCRADIVDEHLSAYNGKIRIHIDCYDEERERKMTEILKDINCKYRDILERLSNE